MGDEKTAGFTGENYNKNALFRSPAGDNFSINREVMEGGYGRVKTPPCVFYGE